MNWAGAARSSPCPTECLHDYAVVIAGGIIPLLSYIFIAQITTALHVSIEVTLAALFVFGFAKVRFTGLNPIKGAC
ncbi:MAG: VIT1/CCC1 transporter family protein [Bacteroidetes bacterium]|nr:VIT1/CCC1 transporter family protein [Bacteroidota bacterium]